METRLSRPETLILLLSARPQLEDEQAGLFKSLFQREVDWDYLLPALSGHYLLPLFLHHRHTHLTGLPTDIDACLKSKTIPLLQRQLTLAAELDQVLGWLAEAGIQALTYKGPALAQMCYGTLALRPFQDLDLLVNPRDLKPCLELLVAKGYNLQEPHHGPERMEILLRRAHQGYEVAMDPQKWLGAIDVHWRLMPPHFPLEFTFEELWQRRMPAGLGPNVVTLSREDTILIHCVHCVKHGWRRLEWIAGMLTFLALERSDLVDWDVLLDRAQSYGLRRLLLLGVQLALDLAAAGTETNPKAGLPARLLQSLEEDAVVPRLSAQLWDGILGSGSGFEARLSTLTRFLVQTRERPSDRRRQAIGAVLTAFQIGPEDINPHDRTLLIPLMRRLRRRTIANH
jgi:hypothetical protein